MKIAEFIPAGGLLFLKALQDAPPAASCRIVEAINVPLPSEDPDDVSELTLPISAFRRWEHWTRSQQASTDETFAEAERLGRVSLSRMF